MRGLDDRSRDEDGRIRKKRGDTKVGTLRKIYGEEFGEGMRSDARLDTLLRRKGMDSLDEYLRHSGK